MSGVASGDVELQPAGLDLLDQVLGADLVGAGLAAPPAALSPWANTSDADRLAHAVRQHDRAADHLVGVAGVDAEADVGLDGRIELDLGGLLEQLDGLRRAHRPCSRSTSLATSR